MERNNGATVSQRVEGAVILVLLFVSYIFVVGPLLGDLHPMFSLPPGESYVDNHLLDTPREWALILYLPLCYEPIKNFESELLAHTMGPLYNWWSVLFRRGVTVVQNHINFSITVI